MRTIEASRRTRPVVWGAVLAAVTLIGAAGMTCLAGVAQARATTGQDDTSKPPYHRCIAFDNVRYWRYPNVDPLGHVHKGQGFDVISGGTYKGDYWYKVRLWGGMSNVWVLERNTTVCT